MKSLYSFLVMVLMALPVSAQKNLPWVGTFATAAEFAGKSDLPQKTNLANTSLREIVQVSLGGKNLQLQFLDLIMLGRNKKKHLMVALLISH